MKKSDQIAIYIIIPIISFVLLLLGILEKKPKYIYISILSFVISAINIGFDKMMNRENIKKNRSVEKLKRKTNRTLFKDLYIASTNNSAQSKIYNSLNKHNKDKNLKDLEVYPSYNRKDIIVEYYYKDFFISYQIEEDKISYNYMVADIYYDYSDLDGVIKEFEKETTIYESVNENENYDEVINCLVCLFNKSNEQIDRFIKNTVIEENHDYFVKNIYYSSMNGYKIRFIIGVIFFISTTLVNILFAYIGYDKFVVESGLNSTLVLIPNFVSTIALSFAIYIPLTYKNRKILNRNLRLQNIIFVSFVVISFIYIISLFIFRFNTVPSIISIIALFLGSFVYLFRFISRSSMISFNSFAYEPIVNRLLKKNILDEEIVMSNEGNRYCLVVKNEKLYFCDRVNADSLVVKLLVCALKKKLISKGSSRIMYIKSKINNLYINYQGKVIKIVKNNKIHSLSHTLTKQIKVTDIINK